MPMWFCVLSARLSIHPGLGKSTHVEAKLLHGLCISTMDQLCFAQRSILAVGLDKSFMSVTWPHGTDLATASHFEALLI